MGPFAGARFGVDIPYRGKSQSFKDAYYKLTGTHWPAVNFLPEHRTSTYMAYLLADETITYNAKNRLITVRCPVDVEISNAAGTIVASVVDNTCVGYIDSNVQIYVLGESKYVLLSGDSSYTVRLTGTDSGTMAYSVQDINYENDGMAVGRKSSSPMCHFITVK